MFWSIIGFGFQGVKAFGAQVQFQKVQFRGFGLACGVQALCVRLEPLIPIFYWLFGTSVMIKRDSWGHPYCIVRGEILGFMQDELVRKHLPKMFSLIKNES